MIEIPLNQSEVSCFYDGVCNSAFWPLYHDSVTSPIFRDDDFEVYHRINQRFASCVASNAPHGALVWVHDYQLQLVPALLRAMRPDVSIGFFLHVPFPAAAEFDMLPWKDSVLRGLIGADLIGFQTASSAGHFIEEACRRLPATRSDQGLVLEDSKGSRGVTVDVFPIGPDTGRFSALAATPAVREAAVTIRANFGSQELILLGVDRLDYTKGIDLRIRAVTDMLKSSEFRDRNIQFIQVAVPSRSELAVYQQLRVKVEETLRQANEELAALGLLPIHYIYETLAVEQVVALYLAADIMLVTSLADGMNLVSKEYVTCREDGTGRLVLSRAAGAAAQLGDAWLVDPGDCDDLKRGIAEAILAGADEARARMGRLRRAVFNADARQWTESFLTRLRVAR
jgi:trehalose 6-phosphate synthase